MIQKVPSMWIDGHIMVALHDYRKYPYEDFQKYRKTNPQALHPVVKTVKLRLTPAIINKDIETIVAKHLEESTTKKRYSTTISIRYRSKPD